MISSLRDEPFFWEWESHPHGHFVLPLYESFTTPDCCHMPNSNSNSEILSALVGAKVFSGRILGDFRDCLEKCSQCSASNVPTYSALWTGQESPNAADALETMKSEELHSSTSNNPIQGLSVETGRHPAPRQTVGSAVKGSFHAKNEARYSFTNL